MSFSFSTGKKIRKLPHLSIYQWRIMTGLKIHSTKGVKLLGCLMLCADDVQCYSFNYLLRGCYETWDRNPLPINNCRGISGYDRGVTLFSLWAKLERGVRLFSVWVKHTAGELFFSIIVSVNMSEPISINW